VGVLFIFFLRRQILFGRLFSLYLILYGVFRFLTEFIRDTPKLFGGFSGYQVLAALMILLGAAFLLKRTLVQPQTWREFKPVRTSRSPSPQGEGDVANAAGKSGSQTSPATAKFSPSPLGPGPG
jgi:hypothetical protein